MRDDFWEIIIAAMISYWKSQGCSDDLARENAMIEIYWSGNWAIRLMMVSSGGPTGPSGCPVAG